ncbi:MAG TPA: sigma 54-interacting transcriptional regulator [Thermoanaerobacterales bacterium]|nr:sigma 54-interacting transcriptional regulator [Thermoanaerobacterales bacterium]
MPVTSKVVALVAGSESTRTEIMEQLKPLLEDYIKLESYNTESGINTIIKADLVVLTSFLVMEEAKTYLDPSCPTIIARRAINVKNIDKLFQIPEGTEALLVNDAQETAEETIQLLKQIGIDHIDFIPYYPGCKINHKPEIAITPGESKLAPSFVRTIIDIHSRVIDITTIVEILERLGFLHEKIHFVSAKYIEKIVRLSKQLHHSICETNKMNNYLMKMLNQLNDGIMAFNNEGNITVFNEKCEDIFKPHNCFTVNKKITHIFKEKDIIYFLLNSSLSGEQLFKINDTDIVINKFKLDKPDWTVCIIKNAKQTIDMGSKLRRTLIKKGYIAKYKFSDILGSSTVMKNTVNIAKKLAKVDLSVLIQGESGVGKELFASSIHNESSRSNGPFLAVNFSALSENLAESELFGYEEGAFTGAKRGGKIGLFEQANGGTIFLDEIGDTSLNIQAKLLRVLQEREIMRVGGTEIIPVDVRVIAATNKDLSKMCREGKFREDLYYRLKVLYLKIPPLRDHKEDIDELIQYFLLKNGRPDLILSDEVKKILYAHKWPGNVRELENTIEYMVAVCDGNLIDINHIPLDFFILNDDIKSREDNLSEELSNKGNFDELVFILKTIRMLTTQGKIASRKALVEAARSKLYPLTEEQIRYRTDILKEMGLVVKYRGCRGMQLTSKGKELIDSNLKFGILNG